MIIILFQTDLVYNNRSDIFELSYLKIINEI